MRRPSGGASPEQNPQERSRKGSVGSFEGDLSAEERRALSDRDSGALERFYELYFDRVYGYVRRLLGDDHQAEDVSQDIFMQIHRSLPSYDPERPLRPWVFTIATNKVRDLWASRRHRESRRELSIEDEERGAPILEGGEDPSADLEQSERETALRAAIDELPVGMRTTLVMRAFEGMSFAEIGRIHERTEVAIRKRYSRAVEELRQRLLIPDGDPMGDLDPTSDGDTPGEEGR